jgi:hypothetical protein
MVMDKLSSKIDLMRKLLSDTSGKFFTVTFVKKDGTIRNLTVRTGVTSYLTDDPRICVNGTSNTTAHIPKYFRAYDIHKKGYRTINLETIMSFKCGEIDIGFKDVQS